MSENEQRGRRLLDRRTLLRSGAAAAVAAPLGVIGAQAFPFRAVAPAIDLLGISDLQDGIGRDRR